ncbi:hypothetical protein AUJ65_01025 [Candidatus Micrarchaeota archaeon CG1_02_51_15]|nr:MAG: hypothetical protein AUJ65_01025 [Candidatus Micrarchaeota archaeon CG1_02_51_15]
MAFVERIPREDRAYYFVSASHRLPGGGWKKLRKYIGTTPPGASAVAAATKELEYQARSLGLAEKFLDHCGRVSGKAACTR